MAYKQYILNGIQAVCIRLHASSTIILNGIQAYKQNILNNNTVNIYICVDLYNCAALIWVTGINKCTLQCKTGSNRLNI